MGDEMGGEMGGMGDEMGGMGDMMGGMEDDIRSPVANIFP